MRTFVFIAVMIFSTAASAQSVGVLFSSRPSATVAAIDETRRAFFDLEHGEHAAELVAELQVVRARIDQAAERLEAGDSTGAQRSLAIARAYCILADRKRAALGAQERLRAMRRRIDALAPVGSP